MKQNAIHYNMYCLLCNMQPTSVYSYWPGEKGALEHVIAVQLHNVMVHQWAMHISGTGPSHYIPSSNLLFCGYELIMSNL